MSLPTSRVAVALAALVAVSCAKRPPPRAPVPLPADTNEQLAAATARREAEAARAPARSRLIGTLERRVLGPRVTRSSGGGLVAWMAPAPRGGSHEVTVVPLAHDGAPLAPPRSADSFADDPTSLVVRPAGASRGGWIVAWSALLDRGESLRVIGLAPDGTARAPSVDVQRTTDHIPWADVVPTPSGAVCVWAEETAAGDADILTAPLDPDGKPVGLPVRVARSVDRWQAVPADQGVGLALVTAPGPAPRPAAGAPPRSAPGTLAWLRLDGAGHATGAATTIAAGPTVGGAVEVAPLGDGWLLAWADRTGQDEQIDLATVDRAGRVRGPERALTAVGGSSLVALAGNGRAAALAWEEPHARTRALRTLHLASIAAATVAVQPASSVEIPPESTPELVGSDGGFALLIQAPVCDAGATSPCGGPLVPTVLRFDDTLRTPQAEPFLVGEDASPAAAGWGLSCAGEDCFALAASGGAPTSVFSVDVPRRASPFSVAVAAAPPPDAPRVVGLATIASGAVYEDLAAAPVGGITLIAALAGPAQASAPGDRRDRRRSEGAAITLHPVDEQGQLVGEPRVLTSHALATGGLAMAPSAAQGGDAAVAWIANDGGAPQVFVARVDARGKRTADGRLTRGPGGASSVALAAVRGGWIATWVEGGEGRGEVHAERLDGGMHSVGRDERVTGAAGDAADVAIAARGDDAWVAWSDARESSQEGRGDVYVARLRARDARRVTDEVRVLATAAHSRSPQIVATDDGGALVAWIEDPPPGVDAPGAAMLARLDPDGRVSGSPARLPLSASAGDGPAGARPTSLILQRAPGGGARVIIARSRAGVVGLDALAVGPAGEPGAAWPLFDLEAPGAFEVALGFAGDAVVFEDLAEGREGTPRAGEVIGWQAARGARRIRRAAVLWPSR
jgi:hypothetical protein